MKFYWSENFVFDILGGKKYADHHAEVFLKRYPTLTVKSDQECRILVEEQKDMGLNTVVPKR